MAGFCTVADLEAFLQLKIADDKIVSAQRAIDASTAAIQAYCGQALALVVDDEIILDVAPGQTRLFLPELPVLAVSTVVEHGVVLVERVAYLLGQHGVLHRLNGSWAAGIQTVTVTYTHGRDPLPDDILDVCVRAAARAYQAGLRAEALEGVPGIQAESLGDHSVTYGAEAGGEAMVMGASASPILLKSEKQALNRYRI